MFPWILVALAVLACLFELKAYKLALKKQNLLNEYTQFLLFNPEVYKDHRFKFRAFLESIGDKNAVEKAMISFQMIEGMAEQLEKDIVIANAMIREKPKRMDG
jgi:hypothetical protein